MVTYNYYYNISTFINRKIKTNIDIKEKNLIYNYYSFITIFINRKTKINLNI